MYIHFLSQITNREKLSLRGAHCTIPQSQHISLSDERQMCGFSYHTGEQRIVLTLVQYLVFVITSLEPDFCSCVYGYCWPCGDCLLPPVTKLQQGNVFTSVCQEFFPQGGLPDRDPTWTDPLPPWTDTPRTEMPLDRDPPRTAGGTHPIGMHSCCLDLGSIGFPVFCLLFLSITFGVCA